MKEAIWRSKHAGNSEIRHALYDAKTKKELVDFGAYRSWDNPRAEEASFPLITAIEERAIAAGYQIVENYID